MLIMVVKLYRTCAGIPKEQLDDDCIYSFVPFSGHVFVY